VDKFLGRPSTAPVQKTLTADSLDDAKRTWDKIRFGEQTSTFKGV